MLQWTSYSYFVTCLKKNGNDTKLLPPTETVQKVLEKTVVYKMFNIKEKGMMMMNSEMVERYLAPVWNQITYIGRGTRSVHD